MSIDSTRLTNAPPVSKNRKSENSPDTRLMGVLAVDKPAGPTSHDVVDIIRRLYHTRRVGHTGTLDPAASGLMLLLLGRATKIAPYLSGLDKTYQASITFGYTSNTGDSEGELTRVGETESITPERIREVLTGLTGEVTQHVPAFAGVHSGGRRRYELARRGEPVPPLERTVTVYEARLQEYRQGVARVEFRCSSGTYVRSLAEMLGEALGCGAYLSALRRMAVGRWTVNDALTVDALQDRRDTGREMPIPAPVEQYLDYPQLVIDEPFIGAVTQGQPVVSRFVMQTGGRFAAGQTVLLKSPDGRLLAIGHALFDSEAFPTVDPDEAIFCYRRVLA